MPDYAAQTNTNLVKPTEIIHVDSRTTACDEGDGAFDRLSLSMPSRLCRRLRGRVGRRNRMVRRSPRWRSG